MSDGPAALPPARVEGGKFRKGSSGNPRGRKRGVGNHITEKAREILNGHADAIMESLCREAIAGEGLALKLCVERLIPLRRGAPVLVELPRINVAADAVQAIATVMEHVARGNLSPEEAGALAVLVDAGRRTIETAINEDEILSLEAMREQS